VFDFLSAGDYTSFFNSALELIRGLEPAALTLDMCPAVFEGYMDLQKAPYQGDNPFERLIDRACFLVSEAVVRSAEKESVVIADNGIADVAFSFRLGKALQVWAASTGGADWAALGRSLLLSVLALGDNSGAVPETLEISETGTGFPAEGAGTISSARLYRMLNPGEYYPRAVNLDSAANSLWVWTASSSVSFTRKENTISITVSFPVNETHYMIIRGIRPFAGIWLYNINWPTDPQFENYDSSGWMYYAQERILVLKIKHRVTEEQVRIVYEGQE
jgi:hypothetical protein